jgi:predicted RNA-binding Zn-ribbon protein involved in translation (DUF1610 family)
MNQRQLIQQRIIALSANAYGCADCPFTSSYKSSMVNHIEAKHSDSVIFPCPNCEKVCNSRVALAMHNRRVHQRPPPLPPLPRQTPASALMALVRCQGPDSFACAECPFVSDAKFSLFEHIRSVHLLESL